MGGRGFGAMGEVGLDINAAVVSTFIFGWWHRQRSTWFTIVVVLDAGCNGMPTGMG